MSGLADELEALVAKATPGPWEIDTQRNEDCSPKHYDYLIGAPDRQGKWMTIFDSVNSDEKLIEEEYDEDYHSAWDAIGKANADLIVELVNAAPTIIAALRQSAAAPTLLEALYQYRDDLRHPPTEDSKERRLEMIARLIERMKP